ncbi:glycosyltransferase family 4 protein [Kaistia sp. MMO-174]|uniref:glycosyltransferase family 4 protein n=1 Tax=Kaistia sp. MMO-174 TaxID=3081256 RepID=UPI001AC35CD9|nr:glycosyltransferase family 4 protein [Hyphomicrobiales bacterium]
MTEQLDEPHARKGAKFRIVHCFRSPVGGIFRHVRDLAEAQAAEGHSVGIVCDSSTGGAREEELIQALLPHLELGLHRTPMQRQVSPSDLLAFLRLFRRIRALDPDIIHTHGAKGGVYGRGIGTLLRVFGSSVARIYCPHGGSLHYDSGTRSGRLFFRIEHFLETMTDALVFVSHYEAQAYAQKVGAPRKPWRIVPNGIREEEFEPVVAVPNPADFLYIGMMRDLKGTDVFIHALARLRDRRGVAPSAEIVGDGPDKESYEALVRRLGLEATTRFHPAMATRTAFGMARMVVVPSRAESMPYVVLEAAAAARPIIATRVGGIPEIFASEQGRLVAPGDAGALADAMGDLLDDPARAAEEALRLQHLVHPRFSIRHMTNVVGALYRDCREDGVEPIHKPRPIL